MASDVEEGKARRRRPMRSLLVIVLLTLALTMGTLMVAFRELDGGAAPKRTPMKVEEYKQTSPMEWLTAEQKRMVENYVPEFEEDVPCYHVGTQYLGGDLPTVPIPKSWCDKCNADGTPVQGEEPNYLFVLGDPGTGTTALHGTFFTSELVTHLCRAFTTRKRTPDGIVISHDQLCEGHKFIIPKGEWQNRWKEGHWPWNFETDVLEKYEALWNHDRCFRSDKVPPYSIKVFQIVKDLIEDNKHRVAFVLLTRSSCTKLKHSNTYINLYAQQYQYLLDNNIPVLHVRYEDMYRNIKAVEKRVNDWAGCVKVDFSLGYDALDKFQLDKSLEHRMEPLTEYIGNRSLEELQVNKGIPREQLAGMAYFGYILKPFMPDDGDASRKKQY